LITEAERAAVDAAREEAVALIEARGDLFAASAPQRWRPDPAWATPSLVAGLALPLLAVAEQGDGLVDAPLPGVGALGAGDEGRRDSAAGWRLLLLS
jgi:hypothetical protein